MEDRAFEDATTADIVTAAAGGSHTAWNELVRRYGGLVWATARTMRLSTADAEDVSQVTWLTLATHIRSLREPAAVSGWLVTTARREGLRLLQRQRREQVMDVEMEKFDEASTEPGVEDGLLRQELRARVRTGLDGLPVRCQRLLRLLSQDPAPTYAEISLELDMPVGSIGPIRSRCLERLRRAADIDVY